MVKTKDAVTLLGEVQQAKESLGPSFDEQQRQSLAKFEANQQYLASKRAEYDAKHAELRVCIHYTHSFTVHTQKALPY